MIGKFELLGEFDLRPQRLVLERGLLVVAKLAHRHHAFLHQKSRQRIDDGFRQRLVIRLLGIEADRAVVTNAELAGAKTFETGNQRKIIDEAADIGAGLPKPERRLDHRDHA